MGFAQSEGQCEQTRRPFDEAVTIFLDADALDGPDLQHSRAEARFRRLGQSIEGRILMVVYTLRRAGHAETIRVISASRWERTAYAKSGNH